MLGTDVVDFDRLEAELEAHRSTYRSARPFPHIVLDDVVRPDALAAVYEEFRVVDEDTWRKYLHVNERKYANTDDSTWGPMTREVAGAFASDRFLAFLGELTGFEDLIPDTTYDGGGLHRSLRGGYLNVHADFTAHHAHESWRRRVNLLLYLNEDWDPAWGGSLELWSRDMQQCEETVVPLGNRMLLFTTSEDAYHGHPDPLACPPGHARQSMALYYFTEEPDPLVRATDYRGRPGDGAKKAAIYADKQLLRAYDVMKRHLPISDDLASRALAAADRVRRLGRRGPDVTDPT
jgi:hypothetical protein